MSMETCYKELGGDYKEMHSRIPSDALIRRFIGSFLNDPSFGALCEGMAAGDRETAFRAVHTLKGVCANLGFEKLRLSASALTEVLRPETGAIPQEAFPLLQEVRKDYEITVAAIQKFMAEA